MTHLWVRTEASQSKGMGHFMRCFAIAEQACLEGLRVTFLVNDLSDFALNRLLQIGANFISTEANIGSKEDSRALMQLIPKGDVILLDSYEFDHAFFDRLYADYMVVVMDDICDPTPLNAHIIINAAANAHELKYNTKGQCLLGPAFAQIRQEFRRPYPKLKHSHLSVMFGGSDPIGYTLTCAEALLNLVPDYHIRLIIGPANTQIDSIRQMCAQHCRLKLYLSPDNVAEVLNGSDLVVTAAGGSVGEVASLCLPALVMVVADNQKAALKDLPYPVLDARLKWPDSFDELTKALLNDPKRAHLNATKAHALVDGRGVERIIKAIQRYV
jgi:UDP-2,4-diacetamido-2,4,6-trideoxy-beta-L-altropyranose hydrolase